MRGLLRGVAGDLEHERAVVDHRINADSLVDARILCARARIWHMDSRVEQRAFVCVASRPWPVPLLHPRGPEMRPDRAVATIGAIATLSRSRMNV